jgi:hypothetical protein
LTARLLPAETAAGRRPHIRLRPGDAAALVQAMAGLGGASGADGLNPAGFDIDVSQQQFLTAPQYARG